MWVTQSTYIYWKFSTVYPFPSCYFLLFFFKIMKLVIIIERCCRGFEQYYTRYYNMLTN